MASSSSSRRTWKYDVFPSFRGEDVRRSFLSHFLEKLRGKSVNTFTDNSIQRSRPITPELLSAIRESRISILVFSKNYASSTWCLNELAAILGCYKELGQIVIPVFYEVDPSDVRKQTGEFGKAFEKTCEGKREDDIKRWKKALEEVASIAGYDSRNWSDEAKMIEHISSDVSNKLFTPSVGIGAHVEAIMDSLLCLESVRVRIVEILGPSGIGKSTIANIAGEDSKNWYSCGDSLDNMKRDFTPIAQLNHVAEKKIWKIKARVSRIWRFQNNDKPGDVDRLELILVDDKGDRIQACIGRKLISKFEKDFEEGECRILMNFKLFRNGGSFRGSTHPFKIFFTWSTYVKNCEEIPNHSLRFNFIPFEELLSQSHDEKVFVDVIGEIIEVHGLKKVNARNVPCKLLNLQLKSISGSTIDCVFWGKYAEDIHAYVQSFSGGPIVMLCSLMRINIYNGKVSIQSVKSSTKLFMNVDIAEINEFKEKMPKDVISTTPSVSILALSNSDQVSSDNFSLVSCKTISQLLTSHKPQEITCSIYATICALKTEIPWFYIGCTKCFKKVNEYLNPETEEIEADKFTCDTCEKICTSTVTRYQVHVKAMDETGTTSFLLFDKEVIQLIHKSTYELLEQQVQFNRRNEFPPELLALDNRQFVFTVYKPSTTKNSRPTTFKVVKITDDPAKLSMFCGDDVNTNDTAAIGPNFSNSTAFTTNLIDDVSFKASKNNSTSGSTEYPETPNKKRTITYVEMSSPIEDSNAQLSSKKHKPKLAALTGGETGQPKPKAEPRTN